MGTRARVNIFEGNEILVSIYRQFDGYPSGLGDELAEFVNSRTMVSGHTGGKTEANGIPCLAAQIIAHLKEGVSDVYIRDTGSESHGEEFIYNLSERNKKIWLDVLSGRGTAFGLPGDSENEMTSIYRGRIADFDGGKLEESAA